MYGIPIRRLLAVLLVPAFLAAAPAAGLAAADEARPAHAIAMHGDPRYPAGFDHFDYADPAAPKGGVFRNAAGGTFDTLNPFIVRGRAALGLGYVTESLMQRSWDEPFSLYGLIAESVTVPEDRSWVEFTLNPSARWHDGVPITPADVLFSWRTLRDHGRPNHRSYYARVSHAARTGERSVRFTFAQGTGDIDREMALIMGLMPILPEHYWKDREFDRTTLEPPLGSGPYRVARFEPGRSIAYERVPDYWGRDLGVNRGQYNFDEIRYDYYRDDSVALEAFKAGAYDFRRETDPAKWATGYDFPAARDGRVTLERLPHGRPEPMRGLIFNTRRPAFADPKVREALGYALDFDWINRTLFHGAYRRTASYYPNSELAAAGPPGPAELAVMEPLRRHLPAEAFGPAYTPPATDGSGPAGLRANLRRGQELLAEAGWTVRDGRLVDAGGAPLEFEILLVSPGDEKVALEYARALRRIGVSARVRTVDSAQYQARLESFDFDMTLNRWTSTLSPGNEQLFYWGSDAAGQEGSRNYAGIRSPAVDALARGLGTARDRADLVARVRALDRALTWGHYAVPLYHLPDDRVAYWSRLRRPAVTPVYGMVIDAWWIGE
ncbi:extracellular solute-binding protein [Skermanella mucosa]|uniref:extracellular solute-binding protein n=1 Tax=Skermanella mucosa TaxID=1789672 RepID=UPI00192BD3F9|nr:extracellular solute-binding protein [Skermanella mucosa]UEM21247.1 extracellular solute-binding protein [Skermanella mucosa]